MQLSRHRLTIQWSFVLRNFQTRSDIRRLKWYTYFGRGGHFVLTLRWRLSEWNIKLLSLSLSLSVLACGLLAALQGWTDCRTCLGVTISWQRPLSSYLPFCFGRPHVTIYDTPAPSTLAKLPMNCYQVKVAGKSMLSNLRYILLTRLHSENSVFSRKKQTSLPQSVHCVLHHLRKIRGGLQIQIAVRGRTAYNFLPFMVSPVP